MPGTSLVQSMGVTLLIGAGLEQFSVFAAVSHDSGKYKIIIASQDVRSTTSKKATLCFSKSTNHCAWFCAIQQTALDSGLELRVMKMNVALFDVLAGRHCYNLDNCLGHHVLWIYHHLFLNQGKPLDLGEKDSAASLELLSHLWGAWGPHTGHAEGKRNLRWISVLEESIRLIASKRDLLGLSRSVFGVIPVIVKRFSVMNSQQDISYEIFL